MNKQLLEAVEHIIRSEFSTVRQKAVAVVELVEKTRYEQSLHMTDEQWEAMCADISDRRGLKWEWAKIEDEVKVDIRAAWDEILFPHYDAPAAKPEATRG